MSGFHRGSFLQRVFGGGFSEGNFLQGDFGIQVHLEFDLSRAVTE